MDRFKNVSQTYPEIKEEKSLKYNFCNYASSEEDKTTNSEYKLSV